MTDIRISPTTSAEQIKAMVKASTRGHTEDAPLVLNLAPGTYDLDYSGGIKTGRDHVQMFGAGSTLTNGTLASNARCRTFRGQDFVIAGADIAPGMNDPGRCEHVFERATFRDFRASRDGISSSGMEGDTLTRGTRKGTPTQDAPWITRLLRCHVQDWVGTGNTRHPIYEHGRYGELHVEDSVFAGAGGASSCIKTTRNYLRVVGCKFLAESRMLRGERPTGAGSFSRFIDMASCGNSLIERNEFHGTRVAGHSNSSSGVTMMIWYPNRRTLWGSDSPAPADISFQAAPFEPFALNFNDSGVTDEGVGGALLLNGVRAQHDPIPLGRDDWALQLTPADLPRSGHYTLSIAAGGDETKEDQRILLTVLRTHSYLLVSSFVNTQPMDLEAWIDPRYWLEPLPDDYTHVLTSNKFIRYAPAAGRIGQTLAIRCEGTYPMTALKQYAPESLWHTTANWRERCRVVRSGNTYQGWTIAERAGADFMRFDQAQPDLSREKLHGPLTVPNPVQSSADLHTDETYIDEAA